MNIAHTFIFFILSLISCCYSQQPPEKRPAAPPEQSRKQNAEPAEFTFLNKSGCMIYMKQFSLSVMNQTKFLQSNEKVSVYSIPLANFIDSKGGAAQCNDYEDEMTLKFQGGSGGPDKLQVTSFTLRFFFKKSEALRWWSVEKLEIDGTGSVFEPNGKFSKSYNSSSIGHYIEGPKSFCYACGTQPPFIFFNTPSEPNFKEENIKVKYALSFKNLQVQPFSNLNHTMGREWRGFTTDVHDCVPFMSIGVWMVLISISILLMIIFSGLFMLSSLKSNDRFDDVKGKSMVISVKD